MTRFDLMSGLMLQSKDGEWVRYEDVELSVKQEKQRTKDVTRNLRDTQDALDKTQIALNAAKVALRQFADCNLNDANCASFDVANRRIRGIAMRAMMDMA